MSSSGRIRSEEQSALEFTVKLAPLLTEALQYIKVVLGLVAKARVHANNVVQLGKAQSSSPVDKRRLEVTARREYFNFKETVWRLRESVEGTDNAIHVMNQCLNPLEGLENYTRKLEKDLSHVKSPAGQREKAFEEGMFSSEKNVSSGIQLNIQRCEAIKAQLIKFLDAANSSFKPPAGQWSYGAIISVARLSDELEPLQKWYTAAFNSIYHVKAVVDRIAELETAVLKQGLSIR